MATCILLSESMFSACPDAGFALALGLGAAAAFPRQLHRGLLLAAGVVSVSLLAGLHGDGSSTMSLLVTPGLARDWSTRGLSGMQILAAGTATGLGVAWMSGPRDLHRMLQMGLAGAAATGLGTWAAGLLPAQTLRPELLPLLQGAVAGFISCQVLVFGMLRFTTVRRPPGPHRVNRTLAEGYRTPCLRAYELDTDLADRSPDTQTRDGLGEVAAWVYRLQWTLQDI
ncbi:MAG: hypothetical protein VX265_00480, partial [Myxococcota bacterium]|nr:hypothetical protein [Myxococcota bacterium]